MTANYHWDDTHEPEFVSKLYVLHVHETPLDRLPRPCLLPPESKRTLGWQETRALSAEERRCRIEIPDQHVSFVHAEIEADGGGRVWVRHRSERPTNHTWINKERLPPGERREVKDGDVIRLGPTAYLLLRREPSNFDSYEAEVPGLAGRSWQMAKLREKIVTIAAPSPTAQTKRVVLIQGETGTGKELVALALHRIRTGHRGPYVPINCATVPKEIAESELFGHKKGAFTGATADQEGAFRAANGGSLFLDEIGDLSPHLQPKLLRALQEDRVKPLGFTKEQEVKVDVFAATLHDLKQRVAAGAFREDLYFRLAVHMIWVPPLRQRREDILPLLSRFLDRGGRMPLLHADLLDWMISNPWPGNVRELQNVAERMRPHLDDGRGLTLSDIGPCSLGSTPTPGTATSDSLPPPLKMRRRQRGAEMPDHARLKELLQKNGYNLSALSRETGEDRRTLVRHLKAQRLWPRGGGGSDQGPSSND